ncbi:MAG: 16S rRNA (adenine(1518)-N(6)/adenine(1519)-N(6))-dimethyltransferase RsmA [Clostridium sp.]|jgi:16S rRNA (adenine1518-N6/adenine1519-N6)-dimethyltransferase|nr:16S rRNA (adenine(1518)-N(6)/adenine(1519)-N(6))-dimethyltransferase RsmA [Clostridium sp.]
MENPGIPRNTIAILRKHQFHIRKKLGQNFLTDPCVLAKILHAARISEEDCVLEIGPGIGTLTRALAEAAGKVVAVEIDKELIPILEETLADCQNVTVLNHDVLKLDLRELTGRIRGGGSLKVVANLPYYITTPILMKLLESKLALESITVMVQEEVAKRLQSGPGTKDYGSLSLAAQYYAEVRTVAKVPPDCFHPRPGVGSAVVQLAPYPEPSVKVREERFLFALIRASFQQRRKTLVNGLSNAAALGITKETAARALAETGLPPAIRGEALTLEQFAALAEYFLYTSST